MKKLARLTALLLTGVMLLLLASCGAAPLTPEQQARQEIFNAINEVRKDKGMPSLREEQKLTQLETGRWQQQSWYIMSHVYSVKRGFCHRRKRMRIQILS